MKHILLILVLVFFGCKKHCPTSEECKKYGQCISAENDRCVTGCEKLCKDEGRCTPFHHGERVECVAKTRSGCLDTDRCYFKGLCSPVGGRCFAASDDDCKESLGCKWEGECTMKNYLCVPANQRACETSMGCSMFGKCFLSFKGTKCITAEEINIEFMQILGLISEEGD